MGHVVLPRSATPARHRPGRRPVVGAGLAGTATAYYLAANRPGLQVMLVEASQVGLGATGRSTGIIGPGLSMPMRSLRRRYSDAVAAEAFASTLDGTAEIGRLISAEGIDCDARLEHQVIGALTERQERRMQRHTLRPRRARVRGALVGPEARCAGRLGGAYRAAFAYENVLLVDPYRLVTGLAAAAERSRRADRRAHQGDPAGDPARRGTRTHPGRDDRRRSRAACGGRVRRGAQPAPVVSGAPCVRMSSRQRPSRRTSGQLWAGTVSAAVIDQRNFFNYYRLGAGGRLVFGGGQARVPSGDPQRETRRRRPSSTGSSRSCTGGSRRSPTWRSRRAGRV